MAYNFPTNPTLNQVYTYNGRTFKWNGVQWVSVAVPTSTTSPVFVSSSAPTNPLVGALWFNTVDSSLYVRVQTSSGAFWESVDSSGPTPTPQVPVYISSSPPVNPKIGYLWYSPDTQVIKVRSSTPSGPEWQDIVSSSGSSMGLSKAIISASAPLNPEEGILWYNTTDDNLYLWIVSPGGGYWVLANELPNNPRKPSVFISSAPPTDPIEGDLWFDPEDSNFNIWYVDIDGGQWVSVVPYPQNFVPQTGGTFTGPIYAGYGVPNTPNAYVTVEWVIDRISQQGISDTIFTAKGSLITSTGPQAATEFLVGDDGEFLKVDSSTPTGLTWSNNVDCGDF